MTAEQLRNGVKHKKDIEAVAKELGYDSVADAAKDLREIGVISASIEDEPQAAFVEAMTAKEEPPKYIRVSDQEIFDIARAANKEPDINIKHNYIMRCIGNRYITVSQFSILMKATHEFAEDKLFGLLINNIFDLHNFSAILWYYNHKRKEVYQRFIQLYPTMSGKQITMPSNVGFYVGTQTPISKESELSPKPKYDSDAVGMIATVCAIAGFLLGVLVMALVQNSIVS